ncbi:MAG: sugar phosphate isomerase/epimerase [Christensenellales bacterium]
MVFGISTACFFPKVLNEDAIVILGKLGVRNTEVFFSCMYEYEPNYIKKLGTTAKDLGINICSIHAYSMQFEPQLFSRHARSRKEAFDIYRRVLSAGRKLGADVYVFHGPVHLKKSQPLILNFEQIADTVNVLSDMAKDYGIKLAWENVHYCWYNNPGFPESLAPFIETDNLYFTLDIKQAAQAGYDPLCYIKPMAKRLANVHICDYAQDDVYGITPKMPFNGTMDFVGLKKALLAARYDGAMILEVYSENFADTGELMRNFESIKAFFKA